MFLTPRGECEGHGPDLHHDRKVAHIRSINEPVFLHLTFLSITGEKPLSRNPPVLCGGSKVESMVVESNARIIARCCSMEESYAKKYFVKFCKQE